LHRRADRAMVVDQADSDPRLFLHVSQS
jgi:hypothetical protein